jgi:transposase
MEAQVIGVQDRHQEEMFVAGPLSSFIPDDHILKRVNKVLDLCWLRKEVKELYCTTNGRPGIDPEAAVRLMIAGFFQGITHDRKLMREAQVNLAIRWFAGYQLHQKLPDHSSLTRIRQRWGAEKFKSIFQRTVQACVDAGLVDGETVHIDATLIRADVSWKSITEQHVEKVIQENSDGDEPDPEPKRHGPKRKNPPKSDRRSTTDPDATLTTSSHDFHMEPCYKQHGAVDDRCCVIVDVDITTGQANEGQQLGTQIERIEANTGKKIKAITADAGYAHGANYELLEKKDIDAIIPPQRHGSTSSNMPLSRFRYDQKNNIVKCPQGKTMRPSSQNKQGTIYRARLCDCRKCPLNEQCTSSPNRPRTVLISNGYSALLRARRRVLCTDSKFERLYERHRIKSEGMHGEAKTQHGLRRAVRRGLANVAIQAYLTAIVINLKRLVTFGGGTFDIISVCVAVQTRYRATEVRIELIGRLKNRNDCQRLAA